MGKEGEAEQGRRELWWGEVLGKRKDEIQEEVHQGQREGQHFLSDPLTLDPVSYTHLTLPTTGSLCRSRWSPYH